MRVSWREPKQAYFRQPGLPLCVFGLDEQFPTGVHGHEFSELVLVIRGRAVHVFQATPDTEPTIAPLECGDVFVMHPPSEHGYRNTECLGIKNVLFDPAGLELPDSLSDTLVAYPRLFDPNYQPRERPSLATRLVHLDEHGLKKAQRIIRRIGREQEHRTPGWRLAATAAFTELVVLVCREAPEHLTRESSSGRHGWLTTVTNYLEEKFVEHVRLADLAELVNMSPSSLSHSFKKRLGCSPIEYVLSLRVQRAAEMLRDTSMSVTRIGHEVGFSDSNYFSRQFKARIAMSPSAYRQRYRDLDQKRGPTMPGPDCGGMI
jgi:AraC-like DNA-binding protein